MQMNMDMKPQIQGPRVVGQHICEWLVHSHRQGDICHLELRSHLLDIPGSTEISRLHHGHSLNDYRISDVTRNHIAIQGTWSMTYQAPLHRGIRACNEGILAAAFDFEILKRFQPIVRYRERWRCLPFCYFVVPSSPGILPRFPAEYYWNGAIQR